MWPHACVSLTAKFPVDGGGPVLIRGAEVATARCIALTYAANGGRSETIKMAERKMPVVFPKAWVGLSSAVPDTIRRNGVPFTLIDTKPQKRKPAQQGRDRKSPPVSEQP